MGMVSDSGDAVAISEWSARTAQDAVKMHLRLSATSLCVCSKISLLVSQGGLGEECFPQVELS